jgi:formylglycine-generating enzyme required for sulfatase activity
VDEVVKVGFGASAFWIDRYEASIYQNPDGTGTQYGAASQDYPNSFPINGQGAVANLLYAQSVAGRMPSTFLSWFQAARACRASGKRLPTHDEWGASLGNTTPNASPWPTSAFAADATVNITSSAFGFSGAVVGMPAAFLLGGSAVDGAAAGVLSMNLSNGPVATNWHIGFRCVIPR